MRAGAGTTSADNAGGVEQWQGCKALAQERGICRARSVDQTRRDPYGSSNSPGKSLHQSWAGLCPIGGKNAATSHSGDLALPLPILAAREHAQSSELPHMIALPEPAPNPIPTPPLPPAAAAAAAAAAGPEQLSYLMMSLEVRFSQKCPLPSTTTRQHSEGSVMKSCCAMAFNFSVGCRLPWATAAWPGL